MSEWWQVYMRRLSGDGDMQMTMSEWMVRHMEAKTQTVQIMRCLLAIGFAVVRGIVTKSTSTDKPALRKHTKERWGDPRRRVNTKMTVPVSVRKNTPPEKKQYGKISFQSAKLRAGEQLLLLACVAKAHTHLFVVHRHR